MTVIDLRDRSWRARTSGATTDTQEATSRLGATPARGRILEAGWRAIGLDAVASGLAAAACALLVPTLTVQMLVGLLLAWPVALCSARAYASRPRDRARARLRPVLSAVVRVLAVLAVVSAVIGVSMTPMVLTTVALGVATALARFAFDRGSVARTTVRGPMAVVARGSAGDLARLIAQLPADGRGPFRLVGLQVLDGEPVDDELVCDLLVLGPQDTPVDVALEAGADGVLFVGTQHESSDEMRRAVWQLEDAGLGALMIPIMAPLATPSIQTIGATGLPLLSYDSRDLGSEIGFSKVVVDKLIALAGLIALAPVMLGIAVMVKLTSRGPILFRQARVGRGGTEFEMLKFRTMYEDAEARRAELEALNEHEGGTLFKIRDDPRITSVGHVLRKYSLDELPQLINVLRGEMSLVGPRPPLPDEVRHYTQDAHRRFRVRPGLTGLWQVSGRSDLDPVESARLDTHYVEHWSIGMDLTILARTPKVVVTGEGAY